MTRVFLFGTLRDPALRRIVAGAEIATDPATLPGHAVLKVRDGDHPALVAADGDATGEVTRPLSAAIIRRLDFYEACFGYAAHSVTLASGPARLYRPDEAPDTDGPWHLPDWADPWAPIAREAAREVMESHGRRSPGWVAARFAQIRSRACAAARAGAGGPPQDLRRGLTDADVQVVRHRRPYSEFFSVVEEDLRFRRFDGAWSDIVTRASLVAGDAVTVLPYDPAADTVLLVEQFRHGALARGDRAPWMLEPVAGRIDPGEAAETTARREAQEEAGLRIGDLELVARYYASAGCFSEHVTSFVGLCDLSSAGGLGGADDEHEDILSHVLPFERLMALVASGEANHGPLLISAFWLAAQRGRLRAGIENT